LPTSGGVPRLSSRCFQPVKSAIKTIKQQQRKVFGLRFKQPKVTIFDFKSVCGGIPATLAVKKYGKKKERKCY
jgi:hypothetical protein